MREYKILKYGERYIKNIVLDYWGNPLKLEITDDYLEARKFDQDEYKTDDWNKFKDKNEVLTICNIKYVEEVEK